jgi:Skp family chaperone for outer membrane proteins
MARMVPGLFFAFGIVGLLVAATARNATADPRDDEPEGHATRIALIDMARVFKTSREFERKRDELKEEITAEEETARKLQNGVTELQRRFDTSEIGTEEHLDLEKALKRKTGEFEAYRQKAQRTFLKKESAIYLEIYQQVAAEIAKYAENHGIDLVIRFNSEPIKLEDPQKLLESMNRQVVYENRLDITDEIIVAVNQLR